MRIQTILTVKIYFLIMLPYLWMREAVSVLITLGGCKLNGRSQSTKVFSSIFRLISLRWIGSHSSYVENPSKM